MSEWLISLLFQVDVTAREGNICPLAGDNGAEYPCAVHEEQR
jgi:hypothetical protein